MNVVLFEKRGEIRLGAVLSEGPKNLVLTDDGGGKVRVRKKRVLHELAHEVEDPRAIRGGYAPASPEPPAPVDADLLWSSLEDDRGYSLGELSQLYYGASDDAHVLSLVHGLTQQGSRRVAPWFRLAKGAIERVDAELREQLLERARRQAEEQELHERLAAWHASWAGAGPPEGGPPDLVAELEALRSFALEGTRAANAGRAKRLAKRLGFDPDPDAVLLGLIESGVLPRDVNELPHRRGLPLTFPAAAREAADELRAQPLPDADEDLRAHPTVAIDDAGTHEVDDALSAWTEDGALHLAVHIARLGDRIPVGGALDREAVRRATSVYFPTGHLPMLPSDVAAATSLDAGQDRAALSLVCRVGEDGLPEAGRFVRATINVDRQATYEATEDATVRGVVDALLPVAQKLRARRQSAGAMAISLPPLKLTVGADGEPEAKLVATDSPSNLVVSELMVFYNARFAETLAEARLPALFRSQGQTPQPVTADPTDPLYPLVARRGHLPTRVGTTPAPHRSMGLEAYVQATSPIRRLGDLLAQRQLLAHLAGRPAVYAAPDLEALRKSAHSLERRARGLEEDRRRYWIARWLLGRPEPLRAVVSRGGRNPSVYLPVLDRELPCAEVDAPVGTEVRVRPQTVEPRQGVVVLELISREESS